MNKIGTVSSIDLVNKKATVFFKELENTVTSELPYLQSAEFDVGDRVVVTFFKNSFSDGVIVGKIAS